MTLCRPTMRVRARRVRIFKVALIVLIIIAVNLILDVMQSIKDEFRISMDEDLDPLSNNPVLDCNFFDTYFGPHRSSFRNLPNTSSETFVSVLQRILINNVRHELKGFNDATLLDIPTHPNKGDSAIVMGELSVLAALNVTLVNYNCYHPRCKTMDAALVESMNTKVMVVLGHGGGNVGTWPEVDQWREPELKKYRDFKYVLLGQSAHIYDAKHLRYMQNIYSCHPNVTFLLRDLDSYRLCQQHFPSVHSVLIPDMAFGIGPIARFVPPTMDIIWINRFDKETSLNHEPQFPPEVSYLVSDWFLVWDTPAGQNIIDNSYLSTYNGFLFLQRGRVVVTDRLHGLIMSVLLGLPVVIIDTKIHKLTNYFDTWLRGVDNVLVATSTEDAVNKAITLLHRAKIPEISPGNKQHGIAG